MSNDDVDFLNGFPEHFREVMEFRFSLNAETDRGCALMVASFLDYKLEQLLAAQFVDDSKVASEHLSQSGALGTFSSRINAAYLAGLIGENLRRDLHLIRKIRNDFGHSHRQLKFSDNQIRSRCNELFHFHYIESTDDPRKIFVKTTMSILAVLNSDLRRTKHAEKGKDLYLSKEERAQYQAAVQKLAGAIMDESEEARSELKEIFNVLLQPDQRS